MVELIAHPPCDVLHIGCYVFTGTHRHVVDVNDDVGELRQIYLAVSGDLEDLPHEG